MDHVNHFGNTAFAVAVSFATLAPIASGLRLLTENVMKTRLHLDDWSILGAQVLLFVVGGLNIWGKIV